MASSLLLLPVMLAEQIALAAHGLDSGRVLRVVAEFAAQPGNPRVDRAVEAVEADAAQFLQQIVARQDAAGVAGEQPEQVEFGGGQVDASSPRWVLRVAWLMRNLPKASSAGSLGAAEFAGAAARGLGARRSKALMRASSRRGCTGLAM
jgi:hypothetical protein